MTERTDAEVKRRICEILEDASARVEAKREWADAVKANWQKTLDNAEEARRRYGQGSFD